MLYQQRSVCMIRLKTGFTANLNPESLQVLPDCKIEPSVRDAETGIKHQFERLGYYCVDRDSGDKLVFIGPLAFATPGPRSKNAQRRARR